MDACLYLGICGSCQKKGLETPDAKVECSQQRQDLPSSPPLYCTDRAGCSKPMLFLLVFIILASTFSELIFRLPNQEVKENAKIDSL